MSGGCFGLTDEEILRIVREEIPQSSSQVVIGYVDEKFVEIIEQLQERHAKAKQPK